MYAAFPSLYLSDTSFTSWKYYLHKFYSSAWVWPIRRVGSLFGEKKLVLIWLKRTILSWYTQDEMYLNSQYYNTWSVAHTEWYKRSSLYGKIFGSKVSQQCCISLNIFQSQYFSAQPDDLCWGWSSDPEASQSSGWSLEDPQRREKVRRRPGLLPGCHLMKLCRIGDTGGCRAFLGVHRHLTIFDNGDVNIVLKPPFHLAGNTTSD